VPSYTVGYIDVYRNGVRLVSTDYTATTGTTVVLNNACTVGDAVVTESFLVSSVLNAIPATAGSVSTSYLVDGSVTQAKLGTGVAGNGPAFSVYRSTTQSFSSSAWTKIQYNTENYDTANCYDPTTNYRFTPNVAGYYIFIVSVLLSGSSNPTVSGVGLYKNGIQYRYGPVNYFTWTNSGSIVGTYGAYMNGTTDYVESIVYSNGTSPSVAGDSSQSVFEGYMVRSA